MTPFPYMTVKRARVYAYIRNPCHTVSQLAFCAATMWADTKMMPPVEPALAKVTIFEVAERPRGLLITSAEVDDRVYIGSREWRKQQCNAGSS